jgi:DNA segregation ATPase FtsK/SpoIIIE, S-DNA-T family
MAAETNKKQIAVAAVPSRVYEIIALGVAAFMVLLFLCLISYSETDPSVVTSSSQKTQNWIGVVGANLAAVLFSSIGLVTYFIPLLLGLIAWRISRSENFQFSKLRTAGYLIFVLTAASVVSMTGLYGGIIGKFLLQTMTPLIGKVGSTIFISVLFLSSILTITDFSLLASLPGLKTAGENLKLRIAELFARYAAWREKSNREAEARTAKRLGTPAQAEPKIVAEAAELVEKPEKKNGKKVLEERKDSKSQTFADLSEIPFETVPAVSGAAEEPILPTIISREPQRPIGEDIKEIPIRPMQVTGELETIEDVGLDADDGEPSALSNRHTQDYGDYILPRSDMLTPPEPHIEQKEESLLNIAQELTDKTKEFNVTGRVMHICQGPVVTTYEFKPDPGVKYSRITGLSDDLCLALRAESIRIDRIPGKAFVGIEVPNPQRETILLREVIESKKFQGSDSLLAIALGKTIDGLNYVADLAKMPHLLIAGATGAGKSVGVNSLVVSILYKARPDEVKFIMVDPKRLELGLYADIPHLATPIITDPKRAAISLKWAVSEMERRYKELAGWSVRNIDSFNAEVKKRNAAEHFDDNGDPWKTLPYIVIIIDELADLMMVSGKEVEESITRLAQMARAVGIHLVLATQRPSVDVITGLIKANFPARISFRVSSKVDSRTIIDANGAERLLGRGDMLFLPPGTSQIVRVHGAYVDEKEIGKIVDHIKAQGKPEYDTTITKTDEELDETELPGRRDPLFMDALRTVVSSKRGSTSLLQRHLRIGYGRAAAILDAMVREGYIGEMDGSTRARPVLQAAYEVLEQPDISDI